MGAAPVDDFDVIVVSGDAPDVDREPAMTCTGVRAIFGTPERLPSEDCTREPLRIGLKDLQHEAFRQVDVEVRTSHGRPVRIGGHMPMKPDMFPLNNPCQALRGISQLPARVTRRRDPIAVTGRLRR